MPLTGQILRPLCPPTRLALWLVLLCCVVSGIEAQAPRYREPDFEKKLFAREALLLEKQEIDTAVTALAALAANFSDSDEVDHQLRAKAIAIALRLNGTDAVALAANRALMMGEAPEAVPSVTSLDQVAQQLWMIAGFLDSPEKGKDERVLQFCLADIARGIDPQNLAESNRYPARLPTTLFPGWETVLKGRPGFVFPDPEPEPDPDPDPGQGADPGTVDGEDPAGTRTTRAAKGAGKALTVGGVVERIRADLKEGGGEAPLAIVFSDGEGATTVPLNEHRATLVSALTELQGGWPKDGGVLVLTIDGEPTADQSLMLPSALLADSLIRARKLDEKTAALGFVAPEGSLIKAERLYQRLHALRSNKVATILLPEENFADLEDLALLGELAPFYRFQIILVGSLKEAASLAAAEGRGENFAASQSEFSALQKVAMKSEISELTGFPSVQSNLAKVIELEPRHASARILRAHGARELPQKLTTKGALGALYRATSPVVSAVKAGGAPERNVVIAAYESVEQISDLLPEEVAPLGASSGELLKEIGAYTSLADKQGAEAQALKAKIIGQWDGVRDEFARLNRGDGD